MFHSTVFFSKCAIKEILLEAYRELSFITGKLLFFVFLKQFICCSCQDKSWEDRNEQANEDEEKEDLMQKGQDSVVFRLSKFKLEV